MLGEELPALPAPATGTRNILDITASRWPGMADSLYAQLRWCLGANQL